MALIWKKVIYRDKSDNNKRKCEWFEIKGSRNKSGLTIDKRSEYDSINFMRQDHVDYLGSFYHDERKENDE